MNEVKILNYRGYQIGYGADAVAPDPAALLSLLDQPGEPAAGVLGGRGSVIFGSAGSLGRVAIKQYRRGGVFGHLIRSFHFGPGASRAEKEFQLLKEIREAGGAAPEPLAYITRGRLVYDAWLVMREITPRRNLTQFVEEGQEKLDSLIDAAIRQIQLLIHNDILHVDLHPGNVLVDGDEKVYLLDFDKARKVKLPRRKLRDLYVFRWRRAVIKHRLPPVFSELFCFGMRRQESAFAGEEARQS